jgi:hypothetical protein
MSDETNPALRGRTLKASIALAIVGDEIVRSSSSTAGSSGVMGAPCAGQTGEV